VAAANTISSTKRDHGLVKLPENLVGRDFFVGDIHGDYESLMARLDAVSFDKSVDRVIAVGDLIDRGPDSRKCLELVYEHWFHSVIGNHEDFFLGSFLESDEGCMLALIRNGGKWAFEEDEGDMGVLAADALAQLPLAIEVPFKGHTIGVIHAACTSGAWGFFNLDADVWNRRINQPLGDGSDPLPVEATVSGIDVVVVGHNVVDRPTIRGNTVNIDGGAARGRGVTLMSAADVLFFADVHQKTNNVESVYMEPGSANDDLIDLLGDDDSSAPKSPTTR